MFGTPFEKSEFQELSLKLKDPVTLVQTAVLLGDLVHAACLTSWQMRKVRGILLKDWSEVSKQGREMDKFVVASEVNGKCPCFAEHNSLNKRWSKVASQGHSALGRFWIYAQSNPFTCSGRSNLASGVNQISHPEFKCPDCTFLGFNSCYCHTWE